MLQFIDFAKEFEKPKTVVTGYPVTQLLRFDTPSYNTKVAVLSKDSVAWMALGILGQELTVQNKEILTHNLHWSEKLRRYPDILSRVDPKIWAKESITPNYKEAFKNTGKFDNSLPEKIENLLLDQRFQVGIMDEKTLRENLESTEKLVFLICQHDVLRDDGIMLSNRFKQVANKIDYKTLEVKVYEDMYHANQILAESITKQFPGFPELDSFAKEFFSHLLY